MKKNVSSYSVEKTIERIAKQVLLQIIMSVKKGTTNLVQVNIVKQFIDNKNLLSFKIACEQKNYRDWLGNCLYLSETKSQKLTAEMKTRKCKNSLVWLYQKAF